MYISYFCTYLITNGLHDSTLPWKLLKKMVTYSKKKKYVFIESKALHF